MPILNISKNSVRLKPKVDLSKYERLFALDESLKPEQDQEQNLIKEEDLKTLDNDELELLDFALDHEEEEEDEDEESWTPPASKSKNVETSTVKKIEKPRQCEKVFYLLCLAHSSEERRM